MFPIQDIEGAQIALYQTLVFLSFSLIAIYLDNTLTVTEEHRQKQFLLPNMKAYTFCSNINPFLADRCLGRATPAFVATT